MKKHRNKKLFSKRGFLKLISVAILVSLMLDLSAILGNADTYYNIRINYVFGDGTPAHDAYIATYRAGDAVDLTVTNPNISGFTPMTAREGGVSAETSRFQYDRLDFSVTDTVYYVPELTSYQVVYYKQNIYDDLYKRDNNVPEQYTKRYGRTLKFYYAREGLTNGQPNGKISLTNSTKDYSERSYYTNHENQGNPLIAVKEGKWVDDIGEVRPKIAQKYRGILTASAQDEDGLYEDYEGYRYYYYQVNARYNASLYGKWLIDAVTPVHKKGFADTEICYPGSWATENDTVYQYKNTTAQGGKRNYTIKGIYDRLGDELMFRTRTDDFTTLHFLLSWTNSSKTNNGWNYGVQKVLHFTYETYVELLPKEIELAEDSQNGYQVLIDNGTYLDVIERTFTDTIRTSPTYGQSITRVYGLTNGNRIETIDSGDQYPFKSDPADRSKNNSAIYSNQTAAEIKGLQLENYEKDSTGRAVLNASNTDIDWSQDSANDRHATVKFFYHRNHYLLKWRNGNRLDEDHTRDVMYGAPLNSAYLESEDGHEAGEYRYWYANPEYFNEDLRNHYTFSGWYYTPYYYDLVDKDTATMPADDLTLYAKWTPKVITVSFYANYNDFYQGINRIGEEIPVNYGSYIQIDHIPADTDAPGTLRPKLTSPTEGAKFVGWYYLRSNVPVRFEPENLPVTALNKQAASEENAKLDLFAEWATNDIAKYYITYVEKNHPENQVAQPYLGRSFLWKIKTVMAKTGSDFNEAHAWSEDGHNWWPTTNSHSLIVRANTIGGASPYAPNVYSFEYIQKRGVYYKVEYRDKTTHAELAPPKDEVYSTHGSVKEDSKFIPGYLVDEMSKTITLTASTAETEAEQKAEELLNNVITFYYDMNDSDYVYEVEYYKQNLDNDDYFLYFTENREVEIAPEGYDTAVNMQELYQTLYAHMIEDDGFTRVSGASEVMTVDHEGVTTTASVADNGSVVITQDKKTTVKIYFDRKAYTYKYQYVDYHAERTYLDTPEEERADMWDGVIETHDGDEAKRVDTVVTISARLDITHNNGDGSPFSYWEVRKTQTGPVVAKSYKTQFDLCLMDNYYISPVYGEGGQPDESLAVTLTHLDDSRNRWTDENGEIADNGRTDCLYSDFEIAYLGLDDLIQESTDYRVGMIFERCKTLGEEEAFVPSQCDFVSDYENLTSAIQTALANNRTTASYNYDKSNASLKRSIQINALSNEGMTNRNRVEVGKRYYNAKNAGGNYTNSSLVIKVYAYIISDGEVTLSNPEYICLRAEAQKELAVGNMPIDNT